MPKRFLDGGVCISETIAQLTWFEEVLFYRLITQCDDFGRFWGDAELLRCYLFPRKPSVTKGQVETAVVKLTTVRLLDRYMAHGKAIVQLCSWNKFQNPRAVKSKFPGPEEADELNTYNSQATCGKSEQTAAKCSRYPIPDTRYPISDTRYPIPGTRDISVPSAETSKPSASSPNAEESDAVCFLPLVTGEEYGVKAADIVLWRDAYPAADVLAELKKMRAWLDANPQRRKTVKGIKRFITGWLEREQNRSRQGKGVETYQNKTAVMLEDSYQMMQEWANEMEAKKHE